VRQLAEQLWGKPPYAAVRKVGKGKIILDSSAADFLARRPEATNVNNGESVYPDHGVSADILRSMGLKEDFQAKAPLRFTHRRTNESDIYFVSNPTNQAVETNAFFRALSHQPQLWEPNTGKIRDLPKFSLEKSGTRLPLSFAPLESYFVIFPHNAAPREAIKRAVNFPKKKLHLTLKGPWDVHFDPKSGGPKSITFNTLEDWTQHEMRGIQYYSGIATYRKSFEFSRDEKNTDKKVFLDLGTVHDIARVHLNGQDLGVVWCAPWQVEITGALKDGHNQLEIEVANRWSNRLLGDQQAPDKDTRTLQWDSGILGGKEHKAGRYTFSTSRGPGELFHSGLLGPVSISK